MSRDMQTEPLADGNYRHTCLRPGCGRVSITGAPRHQCDCRPRKSNRRTGMSRQVASFTAAQVRWITAGRPVRSPERIAEIFTQLCRPCEHFRPGRTEDEGSCRLCGCCLRRNGGLLNKIKMATEQCPKSPPAWIAELIPSAAPLGAGA